jgi:putative endonuclease
LRDGVRRNPPGIVQESRNHYFYKQIVVMRNHNYFVYIMTNEHRNVIYTGVTNNLKRRVYEHEFGLFPGFTKNYNCKFILYYEHFQQIVNAIKREKEIKGWRRVKKNQLITQFNPDWKFLNEEIYNHY